MDTFVCRHCRQSRDRDDLCAPPLDDDGTLLSCGHCVAARPGLCNCCGTVCPGVDPAFRGLTLCRACAVAIDS